MSTFNEENPITDRIDEMRVKWANLVKEDTQLIRWLIKKDEARMVEGFHLLEASAHGKIPELFLNFKQPFSSTEEYGKDLVDAWIALWNDEKSRNEVAAADVLPDWDATPYDTVAEKNSGWTFLHCMASFANAISSDTVLMLNVMPHGYTGDPEFVAWIKKCLKSLPPNLKLVVVDLDGAQKFKDIPDYINQVVIEPNLNMHQAMKDIVTASGDDGTPAMGVNLCLLNIAEAINAQDEKQIHHWGDKGLEVAKETKLKSIEATVYIAYGSALYQLKKFDDALDLFKKAEETSIDGLNSDPTSAVVLLQAYNIQASTYLYKRKYSIAQEYFIKTATEAKAQKNYMMQVEASRQAAYSAVKNGESDEAYTLLQEAYTEGLKMEKDTQKFSSMLLISIELHKQADEYRNDRLKEDIEEYATQTWGEDWQDLSQNEAYQQLLTT